MAKQFYNEDFIKNNTYQVPTRKSFTDLTGETFGKVSVVSWAGINKYGDWKKVRNVWWCKCSCEETDYFLVDKASLQKGLTTSCGCNYKNNNSGGGDRSSIEEASNALLPNYEVLSYRGRKRPCKVKCNDCKEVRNFDTFYSAQQRGVWCSCKDRDNIVKDIAESVNYTFVRRLPNNKMEASCNNCGSLRSAYTSTSCWVDECPCKYDVDMEDNKPSCVYFNIDEYNPSYYKIGKADEPYSRLNKVMSSVKKEGYGDKHKFKVKHVKWFANKYVALQVESMYHQWLKDKAVYGFKGTKDTNKVFDGCTELFDVSKEDIEEFNKIYKTTVDYFEKDKPEYVISKDFSSELNIQKPKGKLGVDVWFPRIGKLYEYMHLERNEWKDDIIYSSDNLIKAYCNIRKRENELLFEVDGDYYKSSKDFYEQWCHLAGTGYNNFRDRIFNKNKGVWLALTEGSIRGKRNTFVDIDGVQKPLIEIYNRHKPIISYSSFKDYLLEGVSIEELVYKVPEINMTKIYLYKGKYYSNVQLASKLELSCRKPTFYNRLSNGWDIDLARLIPSNNKFRYERITTDLQNIYPEIFLKLKEE